MDGELSRGIRPTVQRFWGFQMYVFALRSASVNYGPLSVTVVEGQVWDANDPFVKAHKDMFTDTPVRVHRTIAVVEEATAAPGAKRARRDS